MARKRAKESNNLPEKRAYEADPQAYWQKRGQKYAVGTVKVERELQALLRALRDRGPRRTLEVGSGWGRVLLWLRAHGWESEYRMVDFTPSMREGCLEKTGILPDPWDGKALPYTDKSFDFVILWDVLLHVPPAQLGRAVWPELWRVTRRWVYITGPGIIYTPLAAHCFHHDYLRYASYRNLYLDGIAQFERGRRMHYLFSKR